MNLKLHLIIQYMEYYHHLDYNISILHHFDIEDKYSIFQYIEWDECKIAESNFHKYSHHL